MPAVLIGMAASALGAPPSPPACTAASALCYHNSGHVLATVPDVGDAGACCSQCASMPGCVSFTHWIPTGDAAHSCRLYATNGTLVPCKPAQQGTSGWQPRPAPPPPPPQPPAPMGALNVLFIAVDDLRPAGQLYRTAALTP